MPGVRLQSSGADRLVLGLHRLEVAGEGDLRIDDDVLATDELDHEVGADPAVLVAHRFLRHIVDVLGHPGRFDRALELQLAPAAADLRSAEGIHELSSLAPQLIGGRPHSGQVLAKSRIGRGAHPLGRRQLLLHPLERLAQWLDHRLDRQLALLEIPVGGRARMRELGLSLGHQGFAVAGERLPGQRAERFTQLVFGALDVLSPFGRRGALGVQYGAKSGDLGGRGSGGRIGPADGGQPAHGEAGNQHEQSDQNVHVSMLTPGSDNFGDRHPCRWP